jgi:hypothetical protein
MAVSEKRLAEALVETGGNMSAAARKLNITPQAVSDRVKKSDVLARALEAGLLELSGEAHDVIREGMKKRQVISVWNNGTKQLEVLDEPDRVAVETAKWVKARLDKGAFSERTEITGADGAPVFNVNMPVVDGGN